MVFASTSLLADDYTRSCEFGPIHIERRSLLKAASEIYDFVKSVNSTSGKTEGYISLGGDDLITKLEFPLSEKDYDKFPRVSFVATVSISNYQGILSNVELVLVDSYRILKVRGRSHDYVTGLIKVVQDKLASSNVITGGRWFRAIFALIFYFIFAGGIGLIVSFSSLRDRDRGIILILSIILLNVTLFLPPWEKVFPGFLARGENLSLIDRHAALFTFLGLAIAIIAPLMKVFTRYYRKK